MAVVKYNHVTKGLSGKFGQEIVFRQVGDRTIFGARPRKSGVVSDRMKAHRERFKLAAEYAKEKMLDATSKAEYQALAREQGIASAFAAAVADYLKAPEIKSLKVDGYTGQSSESILVFPLDNFKLTGVKITITQADGTILESGDATPIPGSSSWRYITTVNNPSRPGSKVKAVASDKPGNQTTMEIVL